MIKAQKITKTYTKKSKKVNALEDFSIEVSKGEFILIKGESGCGKTTLLLTLAGMLKPTSGEISIMGNNIYNLSENRRTKFRSDHFGFVFQSFHLIPYLSVLENIKVGKTNNKKSESDIVNVTKELGICDRLDHVPDELSAGEKQRTALARALISNPDIIFADEPTGNLDPKTGEEVIELLKRYNSKGGTVVMVTHSNIADSVANRIINL